MKKSRSIDIYKVSRDGRYINNFIATRTTAVEHYDVREASVFDKKLPVNKKYLNRVSLQQKRRSKKRNKLKSVRRKPVQPSLLDSRDNTLKEAIEGLLEIVQPTEVVRFITTLKSALIDKKTIQSNVKRRVSQASDPHIDEEAISDLYVAVVANRESGKEESAILVLKKKAMTNKKTSSLLLKPRISNGKGTIDLIPDTPYHMTQIAEALKKQKSTHKQNNLQVITVMKILEDTSLSLTGEGKVLIASEEKSVRLSTVNIRSMWGFVMAIQGAKTTQNSLTEGDYLWTNVYSSRVETTQIGQVFQKPTETELLSALKKILLGHELEDLTMGHIYKEVKELFGEEIIGHAGYSKTKLDALTLKAVGQIHPPTQIIENLYLGSEYNASNKEELLSLKIKLVVNVSEEIENFFPNSFNYYTVAIEDKKSEDIKQFFDKTIDVIHGYLSQDEAVLVHCQRGVSRSASIVISYLMKKYSYSLENALRHCKEKRSIVKPNTGFLAQLKEFEKNLTGK